MNFNELTKKQKYAIQLLIESYPEIKENGGNITLKQLTSWWEGYSKNTDREIGYPQWLKEQKQFRSGTRGVYTVPLPTEGEQPTVVESKVKKTLKKLTPVKKSTTMMVGKKKEDILTEEEFAAELKAAGIEL